jgi:hypothetical protein
MDTHAILYILSPCCQSLLAYIVIETSRAGSNIRFRHPLLKGDRLYLRVAAKTLSVALVRTSCLDIDRNVLTYLTLTNGLTDILHLWSFAFFHYSMPFLPIGKVGSSDAGSLHIPMWLSLGKFHARRAERRHVRTLVKRYRHLLYGWNHRRVLT